MKLKSPAEGHAEQERPLAAYGVAIALFNALFVAFLVIAGRRGRLPARYSPRDLVLLGVATLKLSRLITKSRVMSAVRAPFTRFQGDAGHGEVDEAARGTGPRRAIGELLICPYCLAQWIAAALLAGLVVAPRSTRAVAAMFTIFGVSDVVQAAYARARQSA
jgi:hypothetical protein